MKRRLTTSLSVIFRAPRQRSGSRVIAAILVVGFLAAQAATLLHELDSSAHTSGQACEICAVASGSGGANLAFVNTVPVAAAAEAVVQSAEDIRSQATFAHFEARAPPHAS